MSATARPDHLGAPKAHIYPRWKVRLFFPRRQMMRSIRFMSSEDLGYARFWPPVPVNGLNKGVVKVEIRPACNEPLPRNSQKPLGFPFEQLTPDSAPDPQPARGDKPPQIGRAASVHRAD